MKANKEKLMLTMARACLNPRDLAQKAGMPQPTVRGLISGRNVRPATLGKVARALGCDPVDIMERGSAASD